MQLHEAPLSQGAPSISVETPRILPSHVTSESSLVAETNQFLKREMCRSVSVTEDLQDSSKNNDVHDVRRIKWNKGWSVKICRTQLPNPTEGRGGEATAGQTRHLSHFVKIFFFFFFRKRNGSRSRRLEGKPDHINMQNNNYVLPKIHGEVMQQTPPSPPASISHFQSDTTDSETAAHRQWQQRRRKKKRRRRRRRWGEWVGKRGSFITSHHPFPSLSFEMKKIKKESSRLPLHLLHHHLLLLLLFFFFRHSRSSVTKKKKE